jgi:hypothetical protein
MGRERLSAHWWYLRWERDDGTVCCRLVTGKTQVAPKVKITIPRMELMAAVNSVRLARKVKEALKIPLAGTQYFTDSSAVLGMLRTKSGRFTEFVGARVSEVKVSNSNVEEEWLWLVGNRNPTDLAWYEVKCRPSGHGIRIGVPGRHGMDERTRGIMAMQEVIKPRSGGGNQEGYDGGSLQHREGHQ